MNRREGRGRIRKTSNIERIPPRTWIVWIAIVGAIITLVLTRRQLSDKILDKWEQQAKRMDGVLDRMERERSAGT